MTQVSKGARIAFGRRFGTSPEARARMDEANAAAIWTAQCRKCKVVFKGTLAAIRAGAHKCEPDDGGPAT